MKKLKITDYKFIIFKSICLLITFLIILFLVLRKNDIKISKKYIKNENNFNNTIAYNKEISNDDSDFFKFSNMLPRLDKNFNSYNIPLKKDDLFYSRQIYI